MAKLTTRDRVWAAALSIAYGDETPTTMGFGFGTDDVVAVMDDPPSRKTIRETLQSMEQLGFLREEQYYSQGRYHPSEDWPTE